MTFEPLVTAGRYDRVVQASLARVWENVFDWEHLPSLHQGSFTEVQLIGQDAAGWRIRVVSQPGDQGRSQVLQLKADRKAGFYQVTTTEGPGRGSRIDTTLRELGPHRTGVKVEFQVAANGPARLAAIGERYAKIYAQLWDEDEAMMQAREAALRRRKPASPRLCGPLDLGTVEGVRSRLPLAFAFGGEPFRLVETEDGLIAHSTVCPHWLGPLDAAPVVDGQVGCPWHGYRFDIRTGCSVDGHGLRLASAPTILVRDGRVIAVAAGAQ